MTSGQETERVHSYNPGARTGRQDNETSVEDHGLSEDNQKTVTEVLHVSVFHFTGSGILGTSVLRFHRGFLAQCICGSVSGNYMTALPEPQSYHCPHNQPCKYSATRADHVSACYELNAPLPKTGRDFCWQWIFSNTFSVYREDLYKRPQLLDTYSVVCKLSSSNS